MRITVIDDHPLICSGIKQILSAIPDSEIKIFTKGLDGLAHIREDQADMCILDIDMDDISGLEIAKIIHDEQLTCKVIMLTLHKDKSYFLHALDQGVLGYLNKDSLNQEILECVEKVACDERYIGSTVFDGQEDLSEYLEEVSLTRKQLNKLTQSEKNIIRLITKDLSTKEIAQHLFVSPRTVENHRSSICKKLQLEGQNSLLKWTMSHRNVLIKLD